MRLTRQQAIDILYGSLYLGGGGGGDIDTGMGIIDKTILSEEETVELIPFNEAPSDGIYVTISPVGSPASPDIHCGDDTFTRIIELLREKQAADPTLPQGEIAGFIPCEIGASSSFGPFMSAFQLGKPVVDACCDGRAHPLGIMGSLGLQAKDEDRVVQVGCGGNPERNLYVEVQTVASVNCASNIIRSSASAAGGLIEVARNPVNRDWLAGTDWTHGHRCADGAYALALNIGTAFNAAGTPYDKMMAACNAMHGNKVGKGIISDFVIETRNALDYGHFIVTDVDKVYKLTFCNEYMALEEVGADGTLTRINTFPDLIVTVDPATGIPIPTAKINDYVNREVYIVASSKANMKLGAGLKYKAPYETLEAALGIEMISYNTDIIIDLEP